MIAAAMLILFGWIGHACIWCWLLNYLYGCPISKKFLRPWRLFTGIIIALPLIIVLFRPTSPIPIADLPMGIPIIFGCLVFFVILLYGPACLTAATIFAGITVLRFFRREIRQELQIIRRDYWASHGRALLGDSKWRWLARMPFNDPFTVEYESFSLPFPPVSLAGVASVPEAMWNRPGLPKELDGLTVLFLSDFHFIGTPSRAYFEAIFDELDRQPVPDIVALGGDFVDSLEHHAWLSPLLGRLKWKEAGVAILGNHDQHFEPERVSTALHMLGFTVLSNRWEILPIRSVPVAFVGNEAPWNGSPPDLVSMPRDCFSVALVHSPDQFDWAACEAIDFVLAGHTHGGQIRLPVIGSIFVPCKTGRRYDAGVYREWLHDDGRRTNWSSVLVVGRGLSGKEPIRFRCPAQVLRITLTSS